MRFVGSDGEFHFVYVYLRILQVTEHTQFVDVYDITEQGLSYKHSSTLIPAGKKSFLPYSAPN